MSHEQFDDIELEKDTKLFNRVPAYYDGKEIMYETWSWDGIPCESYIFLNKDFKDEYRLELEAEKKHKCGFSIGAKYTFINFTTDKELIDGVNQKDPWADDSEAELPTDV